MEPSKFVTGMFRCVKWYIGQGTGIFRCIKWYRTSHRYVQVVKWYKTSHICHQVCQMMKGKPQVCSSVLNGIRLAIDMFRCVKWYRVGHRYVQVCQMIQDKTQVCSGVPNDIGQDTGTCIQSNRWEKYYKGCTVYLW